MAHGRTSKNGDDELIERSVSGIRPIRQMFQEGAAIQISPLATRGGRNVILDLHTRVNEIAQSDESESTQRIVEQLKDCVPELPVQIFQVRGH